jgi:hypothetical protein
VRRRALAEEVCKVIFAVSVLEEVAVHGTIAAHCGDRKEREAKGNSRGKDGVVLVALDDLGRLYTHLPHIWTSIWTSVRQSPGTSQKGP